MGPNATAVIGTECLICQTDNPTDAIICRECSAPMAIVHDTQAQQREPRIVSVIGESNVGKTVYLGFLLDMLSQQAGDFEAVPRGAYSVDLQQNVITHMANRRFPPKTPMEPNQWYWAYYQVRRRDGSARQKHGGAAGNSKWVDLIMPDMAGESLAAEVATPETFAVIRNLLKRSAGTLLLIDAALAAHGSSRPDFFALKMMSYIDAMFAGKGDQRITIPTAILLCKSDYCPECFDDPRQFVQANLNRLWNMCQNRFDNVEFFACSAVGSLAYATSDDGSKGNQDERDEIEAQPTEDYVVPVPLHTALQGILEPFEWIISQV